MEEPVRPSQRAAGECKRPPIATKGPVLALLAVCQLPCAALIAHVAERAMIMRRRPGGLWRCVILGYSRLRNDPALATNEGTPLRT